MPVLHSTFFYYAFAAGPLCLYFRYARRGVLPGLRYAASDLSCALVCYSGALAAVLPRWLRHGVPLQR